MKTPGEWAKEIGGIPVGEFSDEEMLRIAQKVAAIQDEAAATATAELQSWKGLVKLEATYLHWKNKSAAQAFEKIVKWLDEAAAKKLAEPMKKATDQRERLESLNARLDAMRGLCADLLEGSLRRAQSRSGASAGEEAKIARNVSEIWQRLGMI